MTNQQLKRWLIFITIFAIAVTFYAIAYEVKYANLLREYEVVTMTDN